MRSIARSGRGLLSHSHIMRGRTSAQESSHVDNETPHLSAISGVGEHGFERLAFLGGFPALTD